jgi:hypothetical protein
LKSAAHGASLSVLLIGFSDRFFALTRARRAGFSPR